MHRSGDTIQSGFSADIKIKRALNIEVYRFRNPENERKNTDDAHSSTGSIKNRTL